MKAIAYDQYGSLEQLALRDVAPPIIADDEVRVQVRAAGLHVGDVFGVRGTPFPIRFETGLRKPTRGIPGFDLAGVVETVGRQVKGLRIGDEVLGCGRGTCAELAAAKGAHVVPKPAGLSFEHAAALPTSGLAALHGLRDAAKVQRGQKVLINGASGGVGSFAVQIAKSYGAEVTGVCSTRNVELVRFLGADHVFDYTTEDFTLSEVRYDVILDNIENRSLDECRRVLKPGGTLVLNSGTGASGLPMYVRLLKPLILSPFTEQTLRRYLSMPRREDLVALAALTESGALKPVIDRTYPLAETAAALAHIEAGHARGKVVITIP